MKTHLTQLLAISALALSNLTLAAHAQFEVLSQPAITLPTETETEIAPPILNLPTNLDPEMLLPSVEVVCPPAEELYITPTVPQGWTFQEATEVNTRAPVIPNVENGILGCEYSPGWTLIQDPPPYHPECAAQRRGSMSGFYCTSAATIMTHSQAFIPQTYTLDFETGAIGGMTPSADIWFNALSEHPDYGYIYQPMNGARMFSVETGTLEVTKGVCVAQMNSGRGELLPPEGLQTPNAHLRASLEANVGKIYCIQTQEGRLGRIEFHGMVEQNGRKEVLFEYILWE